MLRAVLGLALIVVLAGLAFLLGRSSSSPTVSAPTVAVIPAPAPAEPQASPEQTRARTEPPVASMPDPPAVAPSTDLTPPTLPHTVEAQTPGDSAPLQYKNFGLPIANLTSKDIHDTFAQARDHGERRHEATDIMAPMRTPVIAVDNGIVAKLFTSKPGGLTVYQFDPAQKYAYYYAHLDSYAPGLREGMLLKKGDLVGYVGVTGNSDPNAPHLHFAIFELGPEKHWWEGKPLNPYPFLIEAVGRRPVGK